MNAIKYADFKTTLDLRIGTIISAAFHPDAPTQLILQVKLDGESKPRQIVSGLRRNFDPSGLMGKQVVILANIETAKVKGVESEGMLVAFKTVDAIEIWPAELVYHIGLLAK